MEGLDKLLVSIGAIAEMLGLFKRELLKNGFTDKEALVLTNTFLREQMSNNNKEDNN